MSETVAKDDSMKVRSFVLFVVTSVGPVPAHHILVKFDMNLVLGSKLNKQHSITQSSDYVAVQTFRQSFSQRPLKASLDILSEIIHLSPADITEVKTTLIPFTTVEESHSTEMTATHPKFLGGTTIIQSLTPNIPPGVRKRSKAPDIQHFFKVSDKLHTLLLVVSHKLSKVSVDDWLTGHTKQSATTHSNSHKALPLPFFITNYRDTQFDTIVHRQLNIASYTSAKEYLAPSEVEETYLFYHHRPPVTYRMMVTMEMTLIYASWKYKLNPLKDLPLTHDKIVKIVVMKHTMHQKVLFSYQLEIYFHRYSLITMDNKSKQFRVTHALVPKCISKDSFVVEGSTKDSSMSTIRLQTIRVKHTLQYMNNKSKLIKEVLTITIPEMEPDSAHKITFTAISKGITVFNAPAIAIRRHVSLSESTVVKNIPVSRLRIENISVVIMVRWNVQYLERVDELKPKISVGARRSFLIMLPSSQTIIKTPRPALEDAAFTAVEVMFEYVLFSTVPKAAKHWVALVSGKKADIAAESLPSTQLAIIHTKISHHSILTVSMTTDIATLQIRKFSYTVVLSDVFIPQQSKNLDKKLPLFISGGKTAMGHSHSLTQSVLSNAELSMHQRLTRHVKIDMSVSRHRTYHKLTSGAKFISELTIDKKISDSTVKTFLLVRIIKSSEKYTKTVSLEEKAIVIRLSTSSETKSGHEFVEVGMLNAISSGVKSLMTRSSDVISDVKFGTLNLQQSINNTSIFKTTPFSAKKQHSVVSDRHDRYSSSVKSFVINRNVPFCFVHIKEYQHQYILKTDYDKPKGLHFEYTKEPELLNFQELYFNQRCVSPYLPVRFIKVDYNSHNTASLVTDDLRTVIFTVTLTQNHILQQQRTIVLSDVPSTGVLKKKKQPSSLSQTINPTLTIHIRNQMQVEVKTPVKIATKAVLLKVIAGTTKITITKVLRKPCILSSAKSERHSNTIQVLLQSHFMIGDKHSHSYNHRNTLTSEVIARYKNIAFFRTEPTSDFSVVSITKDSSIKVLVYQVSSIFSDKLVLESSITEEIQMKLSTFHEVVAQHTISFKTPIIQSAVLAWESSKTTSNLKPLRTLTVQEKSEQAIQITQGEALPLLKYSQHSILVTQTLTKFLLSSSYSLDKASTNSNNLLITRFSIDTTKDDVVKRHSVTFSSVHQNNADNILGFTVKDLVHRDKSVQTKRKLIKLTNTTSATKSILIGMSIKHFERVVGRARTSLMVIEVFISSEVSLQKNAIRIFTPNDVISVKHTVKMSADTTDIVHVKYGATETLTLMIQLTSETIHLRKGISSSSVREMDTFMSETVAKDDSMKVRTFVLFVVTLVGSVPAHYTLVKFDINLVLGSNINKQHSIKLSSDNVAVQTFRQSFSQQPLIASLDISSVIIHLSPADITEIKTTLIPFTTVEKSCSTDMVATHPKFLGGTTIKQSLTSGKDYTTKKIPVRFRSGSEISRNYHLWLLTEFVYRELAYVSSSSTIREKPDVSRLILYYRTLDKHRYYFHRRVIHIEHVVFRDSNISKEDVSVNDFLNDRSNHNVTINDKIVAGNATKADVFKDVSGDVNDNSPAPDGKVSSEPTEDNSSNREGLGVDDTGTKVEVDTGNSKPEQDGDSHSSSSSRQVVNDLFYYNADTVYITMYGTSAPTLHHQRSFKVLEHHRLTMYKLSDPLTLGTGHLLHHSAVLPQGYSTTSSSVGHVLNLFGAEKSTSSVVVTTTDSEVRGPYTEVISIATNKRLFVVRQYASFGGFHVDVGTDKRPRNNIFKAAYSEQSNLSDYTLLKCRVYQERMKLATKRHNGLYSFVGLGTEDGPQMRLKCSNQELANRTAFQLSWFSHDQIKGRHQISFMSTSSASPKVHLSFDLTSKQPDWWYKKNISINYIIIENDFNLETARTASQAVFYGHNGPPYSTRLSLRVVLRSKGQLHHDIQAPHQDSVVETHDMVTTRAIIYIKHRVPVTAEG